MDVPVLIYSLATSTAIIISSLLLYFNTRKYRTRYLNLISAGVGLQAMLPLSFTPQGLFFAQEYAAIITALAITGACLFIIGLTIMIWNLQIHQKGAIPNRYHFLLFAAGGVVTSIILGTEVTLSNGSWIIARDTTTRIVMFGMTAWLILEFLVVFVQGVRDKPSLAEIVSLAYPVGIILSFTFLAFRENLPFTNNFYNVPTAIGGVIFSLALMANPTILMLPNVNVKSVILANRTSGVTLMTYPRELHASSSSNLTTAALTGILSLIQEISGKDQLPKSLGYADYHIGIFPAQEIFIYSVSDGTHPLMQGLLEVLVIIWSEKTPYEGGSISEELHHAFSQEVQETLRIFLS